nr:hypothetical protein IF747_04035 [Staphylococcus aureus]UMU02338.1 hypothetical protein IF717_03695 [Staphylococcus aureus]
MKQKIIMFTLVTVILFCAVLIGYQIPKQQVKMKQNQIVIQKFQEYIK